MYIESKRRSLLKAISWRVLATLVTIIIVYIFFHKIDLAILTGIIESSSKIFLYFIHERLWNNVKFGKKRIEPFVLWFTGLPFSGKTTIANIVYDKLNKNLSIPIQRLDSNDVRTMIPEIGFTKPERILHLKRVAFLTKILQDNSISVIASFVSPYKEIREFLRKNTERYVEIYVKASIDECKKRDFKGFYEKAEMGEIKNFTGVHEPFEKPENPELILDTDKYSAEELAEKVYKYVIKKLIK